MCSVDLGSLTCVSRALPQTDGWLSENSARVYETSTETLFIGARAGPCHGHSCPGKMHCGMYCSNAKMSCYWLCAMHKHDRAAVQINVRSCTGLACQSGIFMADN